MVKDFRVEMKLRNNLILRRMEALGYDTVGAFCRTNEQVSKGAVYEFVALKKSPFVTRRLGRSGRTPAAFWSRPARMLADALMCEPADLFSEALLAERASTVAQLELDAADVVRIGSAAARQLAAPPDEILEQKEARASVRRLLSTLTPREERVMRMRFGIGCERVYTLDEVGEYFNVTRERIRQIEGKAIRKLRHPLRSKILRDSWALAPLEEELEP